MVELTSTVSLPSFSIILETENLVNADLEGLVCSLASLVSQDISPEQANEVLLIDSGDAPPELLLRLCDRYPWIKVHSAPPSTGYYKAKMLGASLATGEIIVYADSDCIYEAHWLRSILKTFAQDADIQVVAGETTTRGHGPYGTAMALTYIFPQFSGKTELTPTSQYFLNNVAFRRQFLLQYPIPAELPLYRGNCVIHVKQLKAKGHTIWLNPLARATHAPPDGPSHFFWRFLLIGHDYYWQKRLIEEEAIVGRGQKTVEASSESQASEVSSQEVYLQSAQAAYLPIDQEAYHLIPQGVVGTLQEVEEDAPTHLHTHSYSHHSLLGALPDRDPTVSGFREKLKIGVERIQRLFINNPWHALYFPLALPIMLVSVLLIYVGYWITRLKPDYLVKMYDRILDT